MIAATRAKAIMKAEQERQHQNQFDADVSTVTKAVSRLYWTAQERGDEHLSLNAQQAFNRLMSGLGISSPIYQAQGASPTPSWVPPVMYDIDIDKMRVVTQSDVDRWERMAREYTQMKADIVRALSTAVGRSIDFGHSTR